MPPEDRLEQLGLEIDLVSRGLGQQIRNQAAETGWCRLRPEQNRQPP